jgi:hypothetical protein
MIFTRESGPNIVSESTEIYVFGEAEEHADDEML